jgi:4a-hydroxytetrahydrobiopterin dehydratase
MTRRLTAPAFLAEPGLDDWDVQEGRAHARFLSGSFARGVALVDAIGVLADRADHHPDVDLRYGHVTVWLVSHDVGGLTDRDVELARAVSAAARDLGIPAEPPAR